MAISGPIIHTGLRKPSHYWPYWSDCSRKFPYNLRISQAESLCTFWELVVALEGVQYVNDNVPLHARQVLAVRLD